MAVTTTAQQIITSAYAKSIKNRPGTIATDATELVEVVTRALRGIYRVAARVNPEFFAEKAVVAFAAGAWARPETAESVFRIEGGASTVPVLAAATEVVVVPIDDRVAEAGKPALYRWGQKFYGAGNAGDPTGGSLDFFYSKRAEKPAALASTLDATWVEQFNEFLILEVAIYLAQKDGRTEEIGGLKEDRNAEFKGFVAFLEHETANERRRFNHTRRINSNTLVPLVSMLAGSDTPE